MTFPATPYIGQKWLNSGRVWQWNGTAWQAANNSVFWEEIAGKPATFAPSAHKASHATGGADAISPADIGAVASVPADTVPITAIRALTQEQYDALTPPDPNTLYAIL